MKTPAVQFPAARVCRAAANAGCVVFGVLLLMTLLAVAFNALLEG